jgi:hypothetical protein
MKLLYSITTVHIQSTASVTAVQLPPTTTSGHSVQARAVLLHSVHLRCSHSCTARGLKPQTYRAWSGRGNVRVGISSSGLVILRDTHRVDASPERDFVDIDLKSLWKREHTRDSAKKYVKQISEIDLETSPKILLVPPHLTQQCNHGQKQNLPQLFRE